jgi:hypothetical protein
MQSTYTGETNATVNGRRVYAEGGDIHPSYPRDIHKWPAPVDYYEPTAFDGDENECAWALTGRPEQVVVFGKE